MPFQVPATKSCYFYRISSMKPLFSPKRDAKRWPSNRRMFNSLRVRVSLCSFRAITGYMLGFSGPNKSETELKTSQNRQFLSNFDIFWALPLLQAQVGSMLHCFLLNKPLSTGNTFFGPQINGHDVLNHSSKWHLQTDFFLELVCVFLGVENVHVLSNTYREMHSPLALPSRPKLLQKTFQKYCFEAINFV